MQPYVYLLTTYILKQSKPPTTTNISKQQKFALQSLKQDYSINIIPADEGKPSLLWILMTTMKKLKVC